MQHANEFPAWPGGEWQTVRLIGRGSYGAVYEIMRQYFGYEERSAMKVISIPQNDSDIRSLYSEGYDRESVIKEFSEHMQGLLSEYALMRKLNGNSNIVNCDDVQCVPHDDGIGWDIYIRMELLSNLTDVIGNNTQIAQTVRIGRDICRALVLCNRYEIVHRDIKPANIFCSPNGDYKLGDFGIAKVIEKTSGGTKIGTYDYMAPEVYHDEDYNNQADIYSLGLVLYWLLNERRLPFQPLGKPTLTMSEREAARRQRFKGDSLPPPAQGSEELQRIVLKACAYDPKDRYASAEEMLRDLEGLKDKQEDELPFIPPEPVPKPGPDTGLTDDDDPTIGAFGDHTDTKDNNDPIDQEDPDSPTEGPFDQNPPENDEEQQKKEIAVQIREYQLKKRKRRRIIIGALIGVLAAGFIVNESAFKPRDPKVPSSQIQTAVPETSEQAGNTPETTLLSLSHSDVTIHGETGESFVLKVYGAEDSSNITYSSENTDVASVENNGRVKAVSNGTTTIIVTVKTTDGGENSLHCVVRVIGEDNSLAVSNISKLDLSQYPDLEVIPDESSLFDDFADYVVATIADYQNVRSGPGTSYQLIDRVPADTQVKAVAKSEGGKWLLVLYDDKCGWVSLSFLTPGRRTQTDDTSDSSLPTITPKPLPSATPEPTPVPVPETIVLNREDFTLSNPGDTFQMVATISPAQSTAKIIWISEDTDVATVDENGLVTAVSHGVTKVSATVGSVTRECIVRVAGFVPANGSDGSLSLNHSDVYIHSGIGETFMLRVNGAGDGATITYASDKSGVASVESNGQVKAESNGIATITVTVKTADGAETNLTCVVRVVS